MIFSALAVLLLIVSILAALKLLGRSVEHPSNLLELLERLEPVNVASFRHLACDSDDHHLRSRLSRRQYRHLKRLRLEALQTYYSAAFHNSAVLLSYGELLATNGDPGFAQFGRDMCSAAMQLRLALLRGVVSVWICYLMPIEIPYWRQITDSYDALGLRLSHFSASNFPDLAPAVIDHFGV